MSLNLTRICTALVNENLSRKKDCKWCKNCYHHQTLCNNYETYPYPAHCIFHESISKHEGSPLYYACSCKVTHIHPFSPFRITFFYKKVENEECILSSVHLPVGIRDLFCWLLPSACWEFYFMKNPHNEPTWKIQGPIPATATFTANVGAQELCKSSIKYWISFYSTGDLSLLIRAMHWKIHVPKTTFKRIV